MVESDPSDPLPPNMAKKAIRTCLKEGAVVWTTHARKEMENDDLIEGDIVNTLRCGVIDSPPELVSYHWRYRMSTGRVAVVVTFEPEAGKIDELVIITAWRYRRHG